MSKATGFYAVCEGREIGVFTSWCVSSGCFIWRPSGDRLGSVPTITVHYEPFFYFGLNGVRL